MKLKSEWISIIKNSNNYQLINTLSGQKSEINLDTLEVIQGLTEELCIEDIAKRYTELSSESIQLLINYLIEMNLLFEEGEIASIKKIPLIEKSKDYLFDGTSKKSEIAILGFPYDGGSSGKTGSKSAPDFLRNYTAGISSSYMDINLDNQIDYYYNQLRDLVNDLGNIVTIPGEGSEEFHNRVLNSLTKLINENKYKRFIFIGGDHSVSYPLVQAFSRMNDSEIVYVKFDAHYDASGEIKEMPINHHNYISKIRKLEQVSKIVHVGVREPQKKSYDLLSDLILNSIEEFSEDVVKKFKEKKIYISIDIDVLDPLINPGTGFQIPFGVSLDELISKLELLEETDVIAIDIVEFNPLLDRNQQSLHNVLKILEKSIRVLERDIK